MEQIHQNEQNTIKQVLYSVYDYAHTKGRTNIISATYRNRKIESSHRNIEKIIKNEREQSGIVFSAQDLFRFADWWMQLERTERQKFRENIKDGIEKWKEDTK